MRAAVGRTVCLVLACTSVIAAAPRASAAQTDAQVAAMGCRNAATNQLRSQHPEAQPSYTTAPQVLKRKRGEVQLRGEGQYLDATRGPRRFIYDCAYRPHSARTTISLSFPDSVAKPRD